MSHPQICRLAVLLVGSALWTLPLAAQEVPNDERAAPAHPTSEAPPAGEDGNEIVVTAQRREQRLQDVPLSVSAVGRDTIERAGIQTVSNIGSYIPNIQINQTVGNTFGPLITIRGLAPSADTSLARDQPVGIYVDGVPVAKSTGAAFDLVDLERIEVLRGPQGTLYGKNTIGGAVNLITRKPTGEFGGEIFLGAGSYGLGTERIAVNLPGIGDSESGFGSLKSKVAFSGRQYTGYYRNLARNEHFGKEDRLAGRVDLLWELGRLSVGYAYDITDSVGTPSILAISAPGSILATNPLIAPYIYTTRPKAISAESAIASDFKVEGHALTAAYEVNDHATVKSISSWRTTRTHSASDFDGTPNDLLRIILDNNYHQFSQELQAIGDVGDFKYTVGGFYFRDRYSVYNPRWNFQLGRNFFDLSVRSARSYSIASYGQITYSPSAVEGLDIAVGLRWTRDHKDTKELFLSNATFTANPSAPTAGVFVRTAAGAPVTRSGQPAIGARPGGTGIGPSDLIPVEGEKSWSKLTPELNVTYKIDPAVNIYGRVATGFKSGGFNDTAATNAAFFSPYNPERLLSFELGTKASLFDRRLNFTLAGYHSIYKNFQAGLFVPALVTTTIVNAGKAELSGIEVEGQLRPVEALSINFGYGYLHKRYKDFVLPNGQDVADIYKFPLAPKNNYVVGGAYTLHLGQFADLVPSLNYSWRSMQFTTITGDLLSTRKSYGLLDGRVALTNIALNGRTSLEIAAFAKNLTDEKYWVSGINLSTFTVRQWAEPRSFGGEVRVRF